MSKIAEISLFSQTLLHNQQEPRKKAWFFFCIDWEQRKLGELIQTLPFKPFLKEPEQDGKYEIIQQGNEPVIGFANGIPCKDYEDTVIFGDHTLSLYKPKRPFFVATDGVRIVKGAEKIDGFYLMALLEKYKPKSEGYKRYYGILADSNCNITRELDEQKQIGVFFRSLDDLITLHQRKQKWLYPTYPKEKSPRKMANDWEQRKFSELYQKVSRKNDLTYGRDDIISVANMYFKPDSYITEESYLLTYNVFELGDIAFEGNKSKNYSHGRFVENTIGNGIASHVFDVFRPIMEQYDLQFWKYAINNERIMGKILARCTKASTMMTNLVADDFLKESILLPKYEEQKRIGAVLSRLDDLITLHQRKQKGEDCIRFNRFTREEGLKMANDWEQRKLGEVGKARSGCGFPDTEQGGAEGIPFFKVSDMNSDGNENEMMLAKNYVTEEQIVAHRWNPISELPAIFFAKVGAAVMLNRKRLCRFPFLLDNNTMAYSLNNNYWDAGYAKALFETIDLTALVQVGALPSYNAGDVEAILVWLPTLEEQRVIGAYFKELDDLITLHQRKGEETPCQKKPVIKSGKKQKLTNDWEQRKLGEIANAVTRNEPTSDAPIMMITANNGFIEQSERYAFNNAGESLKKYILLEKGELAYNHGASKMRPYGSCFALTTVEKARIPFVYHCFSVGQHDSEFVSIELNGAEVEKQLRRIVSSGARMDGLLNISFEEYTSIEVLLPVFEEQDKIATCFRTLDNLITLHQRKEKSFCSPKKRGKISFFHCRNKNGWEQRKVGDVVEVQSGRDYKHLGSGSIPVYGTGGLMLYVDKALSYSSDAIGIGRKGTIDKPYVLRAPFWTVDTLFYAVPKAKNDLYFVYCLFQRIDWKSKDESTGVPSLSKQTINDSEVKVATEQEQRTIGAYFSKLDDLITLHQRE